MQWNQVKSAKQFEVQFTESSDLILIFLASFNIHN